CKFSLAAPEPTGTGWRSPELRNPRRRQEEAHPAPLRRLFGLVGVDLSGPEKGDRSSWPHWVLEVKQFAVGDAASHRHSPDQRPAIDVTNEIENGFWVHPVDDERVAQLDEVDHAASGNREPTPHWQKAVSPQIEDQVPGTRGSSHMAHCASESED